MSYKRKTNHSIVLGHIAYWWTNINIVITMERLNIVFEQKLRTLLEEASKYNA